jgi:hypothetical protein
MRYTTLFVIAALSPAMAQDDAVSRAMRDEMARSVKELQIEKLERPYFVSYRVESAEGRSVTAAFGALAASQPMETRLLQVEVRVGDPKLDNTNFFSPTSGGTGVARMYGGVVQLPLEDDYKELRRQLWLATDGAYKKALEDLSRKRAALQNKTRTDDTPDFSPEPAATLSEETAPVAPVPSEMERLVRDLSSLFRKMPDVAHGWVQVAWRNTRTWYLNSDGTSCRRVRPMVSFTVRARTQAPDGMPLDDSAYYTGRSLSELPSRDRLAARIAELGDNLKRLRAAPPIDQYNGPVLFEDRAAGELIAQALAQNLLATRRPVSDNPGFERYTQQMENPFLDRLGGRVMPDFLSVTDNPAAEEYEGARLAGWRKVDDEGVPARETSLIEKGTLKTLLATRSPVRGVPRSTGSRRGSGPMPSNLFVAADNGLSLQELREKFLGLIKQRGKPYGIAIRAIANPMLRPPAYPATQVYMPAQPGETRVEPAILAYKVYPDGREELVRNAELSGVSAASFKEILAASKERTVHTAPFRARTTPGVISLAMILGLSSGGGGGESLPVSFIVPALLFDDLTVKKPVGEVPKPPVAPHPYFDR